MISFYKAIDNNNILIYGHFAPPITGEAFVNQYVYNLLKSLNVNVDVVNSTLTSNTSRVGKWSVYKVYRLITVYIKLLVKIKRVKLIYVTPGQSLLGTLRFLPLLVLSSAFRLPIVAHWHGYGVLTLVNQYPFLMNIVGRFVSCNIFLTKHLEENISKSRVELLNRVVVPNFAPERGDVKKTRNSDESLKVLFLGSLLEEKGIFDFLSAADLLPEIEFIVCGEGNHQMVEKVRRIERVASNLNYYGVVEGKQKDCIMDDADVFVLQSNYPIEGMPIAILEAMSACNAIVTTKHNGITETVGDAAIFIRKENVFDLVEVLDLLSKNRTELSVYQNKAFEKSKEYSQVVFNQNILDILNNELNKGL